MRPIISGIVAVSIVGAISAQFPRGSVLDTEPITGRQYGSPKHGTEEQSGRFRKWGTIPRSKQADKGKNVLYESQIVIFYPIDHLSIAIVLVNNCPLLSLWIVKVKTTKHEANSERKVSRLKRFRALMVKNTIQFLRHYSWVHYIFKYLYVFLQVRKNDILSIYFPEE